MADNSGFTEAFIFFFGGGLFFLLVGLPVRLGKVKRWWLVYSTPMTPIAMAYGSIVFSAVFFLWSLVMFIPDVETRQQAFLYVGFFGFIPSIIITMFRPRWLVPAWLRWLEDNHRDILSLLKKEALQMGGRAWDRRVSTQEDLEDWVAEVRRKYRR